MVELMLFNTYLLILEYRKQVETKQERISSRRKKKKKKKKISKKVKLKSMNLKCCIVFMSWCLSFIIGCKNDGYHGSRCEFSKSNGIISSETYGNSGGFYRYVIDVTEELTNNKIVRLKWTYFNLKGDMPDCTRESITVFVG